MAHFSRSSGQDDPTDNTTETIIGVDKHLAKLQRAANRGDPDAQYSLGRAYYGGSGIPVDDVEAVKWFHKSADQGNANAQFCLGSAYLWGNHGLPINYAEAIKWLKKAADQRHYRAEWLHDVAYCQNRGVPKDYTEAASWYRKSAEQGDHICQYMLGLALEKGEGIPRDYNEAYMWLNLSASNGHKRSIKHRDELEAKMSGHQIAEAQKLSREWKPTKRLDQTSGRVSNDLMISNQKEQPLDVLQFIDQTCRADGGREKRDPAFYDWFINTDKETFKTLVRSLMMSNPKYLCGLLEGYDGFEKALGHVETLVWLVGNSRGLIDRDDHLFKFCSFDIPPPSEDQSTGIDAKKDEVADIFSELLCQFAAEFIKIQTGIDE
jgi:hypothetical protein